MRIGIYLAISFFLYLFCLFTYPFFVSFLFLFSSFPSFYFFASLWGGGGGAIAPSPPQIRHWHEIHHFR